MAAHLTPDTRFQEIHARILLAAAYAHALRARGEYSDSLSVIPGGIYANDAEYSDWILLRYPDGPAGQRWLLIGTDWDDHSPFQNEEDGHRHLAAGESGPGAPAWSGLRTLEDLNALIPGDFKQFFGGAPSTVTWFDEGRWQVSGARLGEQDFPGFDPEAPWLEEGLSWGLRHFLTDEACREFLALLIRGAAGRETFSEAELARLAEICWNAALDKNTELFDAHLHSLTNLVGLKEPEDPAFTVPLRLHGELHTIGLLRRAESS